MFTLLANYKKVFAPRLADLTDVEQRLLSRVVPFLKIIKLQNRFSQSWCRGQVILFAQDVVEVAGIVVVVETLENLPNHKQFQVDIRKIKLALNWLLKYNYLYRDVRPNFANIINYDISQIIEVSESNGNEINSKPEPDPAEINSDYSAASEFLSQITFQGSCVNLNIAHDLSINGHFSRDQEGYSNLENGIASFFDNYTCKILTANFISILMPEGHKGRTGDVSCCLRFENSRQIAALLRSNIFSITPVFAVESGGDTSIESQHSERNLNVISSSTNLLTSNLRTENRYNVEDCSSKSTTNLDLDFREVINNLSGHRRLILSTSMLYDIDENIPNLDSVIESDNRNLNENRDTDIHRKTASPVNMERVRKMEELCCDGKNGLGESRNVSITALDYFEARV
ncbi:hypothetical protein HW555_009661 [Spodoptera exigua]|uniref:DUF6570 domain-containing protein n=1 Tax=Spodoptera exigua TaxID=7107 RepID=A0A835L2A3_SPOEX|nr:hypothetical protein HW555_009661 [Spodoptera exigua]